MPNRLYFRNVVSAAPGTFPSGPQSALTADYTAVGATTLKRMSGALDPTPSMTVHNGTSLATLSPQSGLYGMFVSNRFGENQTISNQTITINVATLESSSSMNLGPKLSAMVYVWRPSTGAIVGTICANANLTGLIEPGSVTIRALQGSVASSTPVDALFADVIIVEIWQTHTQAAATSFTGGFYFDGSTVTTVNNTIVTDHASFINFSFDNLALETGFADAQLNATLGSATLAGLAVVTDPLPTGSSNGPTSSGGGGGYARPQTAPKPSGKPSSNRDFKKLLDGIFEPKEEETLAEAIEEMVQPQKETILLPLPDKNLELLLKPVILKPVKQEEPIDPIILLLGSFL